MAFAPLAYIAFFVVGWFYTLFLNFIIDEGPPVGYFFYHSEVLFRLFLLSLLYAAGLVLACMIHVLLSKRFTDDHKGLWLLALIMANVIALPLYWYFNIWSDKWRFRR
jgi:hypothetical protein